LPVALADLKLNVAWHKVDLDNLSPNFGTVCFHWNNVS